MSLRGRPVKSVVRDRLCEILSVKSPLTAYDAHKLYCSLFAKTSQRNVYYQLSRGVALDVFLQEVVQETGDFSWGSVSRKIYYRLSPSQKIVVSDHVYRSLSRS
jgi:hypothetical protein